jgi:hypothetical protein
MSIDNELIRIWSDRREHEVKQKRNAYDQGVTNHFKKMKTPGNLVYDALQRTGMKQEEQDAFAMHVMWVETKKHPEKNAMLKILDDLGTGGQAKLMEASWANRCTQQAWVDVQFMFYLLLAPLCLQLALWSVSAEYTVWTQHAICVLRFAFVCACVITLEFKVQTYNLFNTSYQRLLRVGSCVVMMGVIAYCEVGVFYRITTAELDDDVTKNTYIGDFHGSISYLVNFCPFLSCMIVFCPTQTQGCFMTLVFGVFTVFELAFIAARSSEAEQCSHFWLEKYSNWTVGKLWIVGKMMLNMMVLLVILYVRICYKFAKVQYLGRISSRTSVLGVMVLFGWMVVVGSTTHMLQESYETIVSDPHRLTGPFAFSAKVSTIQEDVRYTEECLMTIDRTLRMFNRESRNTNTRGLSLDPMSGMLGACSDPTFCKEGLELQTKRSTMCEKYALKKNQHHRMPFKDDADNVWMLFQQQGIFSEKVWEKIHQKNPRVNNQNYRNTLNLCFNTDQPVHGTVPVPWGAIPPEQMEKYFATLASGQKPDVFANTESTGPGVVITHMMGYAFTYVSPIVEVISAMRGL